MTEELLLDSEASLRLADGFLSELRGDPCGQAPAIAECLPDLAWRTYHDISAVVTQLASPSLDPGMTASCLLDGLDRALSLVDELETDDTGVAQASALRSSLRDELHRLVSSIQLETGVSHQLSHARALLEAMQERTSRLAEALTNSTDYTSTREFGDLHSGEGAAPFA